MDTCAICKQEKADLQLYTYYSADARVSALDVQPSAVKTTTTYSNFREHTYPVCGRCRFRREFLPALIWRVPLVLVFINLVLIVTRVDPGGGFLVPTLFLVLPLAFVLDRKTREYRLDTLLRQKAQWDAYDSTRKVMSRSEYASLKRTP